MAKKKPAKAKKLSPSEKQARNRQEYHLNNLIIASERAITGQGSEIDQFFENQAERLKKELKEFKAGR
jgi:hypothetical protein